MSKKELSRYAVRKAVREAIIQLHALRHSFPSDRQHTIAIETPLAVLKPNKKRLLPQVRAIPDAVVAIALTLTFDARQRTPYHDSKANRFMFQQGLTRMIDGTHDRFVQENEERLYLFRSYNLPYGVVSPKDPSPEAILPQLIKGGASLVGSFNFESFDSIKPSPSNTHQKKRSPGEVFVKEGNYEAEELINEITSHIFRSYSSLYDYTTT